MSDPAIRAVVVGGGLNALGAARALHQAGVPVTIVDSTRWSAAGLSRSARLQRIRSLVGRDLVEGLKTLGGTGDDRPVLILNGENEVTTISEARAELTDRFRFELPLPAMVRELADKVQFQAFAERNGLPVPRSATLATTADLPALDALEVPLVLKPADKALALSGLIERALRVDTRDYANREAARLLAKGATLIAQEWIEGEDSDIYFSLFHCDRDSNPTAIFYGRKLACSPPLVGTTALCVESEEMRGEMEATTLRFLKLSEYRGLGGLEFKRDRRSGRFVIVEPTVGRTDWQSEIATLCGVNIPLAAYRYELGLPALQRRHFSPPRAWCSSGVERGARRALPAGYRVFDASFRLLDPMPALYQYAVEEIGHRLIQRVRRLVGGGTGRVTAPPPVSSPNSPS